MPEVPSTHPFLDMLVTFMNSPTGQALMSALVQLLVAELGGITKPSSAAG